MGKISPDTRKNTDCLATLSGCKYREKYCEYLDLHLTNVSFKRDLLGKAEAEPDVDVPAAGGAAVPV